MDDLNITILLASIVAGAAPIVLAAVGETVTEKSGVINLSLDGSILLSAMVAFAVAYQSNNLLLGFMAGAAAGGLVAAIVGVFSVYLGQCPDTHCQGSGLFFRKPLCPALRSHGKPLAYSVSP